MALMAVVILTMKSFQNMFSKTMNLKQLKRKINKRNLTLIEMIFNLLTRTIMKLNSNQSKREKRKEKYLNLIKNQEILK